MLSPAPACDENDRLGTARVRSVTSLMWFSWIASPETTDTLSGTLRTSSLRFCAVMVTASSVAADLGAEAASAGAGACWARAFIAARQAKVMADRTAGDRCLCCTGSPPDDDKRKCVSTLRA